MCIFEDVTDVCGEGKNKYYECCICRTDNIHPSHIIKWKTYSKLRDENKIDLNKKSHIDLVSYVMDNIYDNSF